MQAVGRHHVAGERIDQRLQYRGDRADPTGQGGSFQHDALAGENLGLPVQRQVIVVLRDDNMGQQPGAGPAAGNRTIGCRRRHNDVASPARQLLADMPDYLEAAGHVIERLGDVLADPAQRAAAARAGARGGMRHVLARKMIRQRAPGRLLRLGSTLDGGSNNRRGGSEPLGLILFERLDRQLELLGLTRQPLRGTAKLGAAIARQLELQLGNLGLSVDRVLRHSSDDALQRIRVVGKLIERDRHQRIESWPGRRRMAKTPADSISRGYPATSGRHVRRGVSAR